MISCTKIGNYVYLVINGLEHRITFGESHRLQEALKDVNLSFYDVYDSKDENSYELDLTERSQ